MSFLNSRKKTKKVEKSTNDDYTNLRIKLGLRPTAPKEKIKHTLECLRGGNPKTWKEKG